MTPEEIDDLFKGCGMAIRRIDDQPIPGEPIMSMVTAKKICRTAIQSLTERLAELEAEQNIFIRQINGLVEKLAKADAEIDKLQGFHEEWKRIDRQHRDGHGHDAEKLAEAERKNDELRAALEQIADKDYPCGIGPNEAKRIARAALKELQ